MDLKERLSRQTPLRAGIFALKGKIYAGNGIQGYGNTGTDSQYDWWEYQPASNQWFLADSLPVANLGGTGFAIGEKAYFGLGFDPTGGPMRSMWQFTIDP